MDLLILLVKLLFVINILICLIKYVKLQKVPVIGTSENRWKSVFDQYLTF